MEPPVSQGIGSGMPQEQAPVGGVTRSSTRGFVGAVRLPEPEIPVFGLFCRAEAQRGQSAVIGLIYNISIEDDAFARQVATAEGITPEQLADTRFNRQGPGAFHRPARGLPPRLWLSLHLAAPTAADHGRHPPAPPRRDPRL